MIVLAITIAALAISLAVLAVRLTHIQNERDKYKRKYHEVLAPGNAEDSLIYEWSNRDLMPDWENAYPHVKHMPDERKYSEWATFCANYPTREQMIAQISLDGSHRKAVRQFRGE